MNRDQNQAGPDYILVQTIVLQSVRRTSLWERAMGKGPMVEIPRAVRPHNPGQPRVLGHPGTQSTIPDQLGLLSLPEGRRQAASLPAFPPRGKRPSADFWINTLAVSTLAAFLLSLYFLR